MSKVHKGKEILKMIAEGQINKNTRVTVDNYSDCTLAFVFEDRRNLFKWLDEDFELIEDETIDIDKIEELLKIEEYEVDKTDTVINRNEINELVQAVEQLNKEIKELKSLNIEICEKDINKAIKKAREQRNKSIKEKEYCQVCGVKLTEENKYMNGMCNGCKYGEE